MVLRVDPCLNKRDWLIDEKFLRMEIVFSENFIVWGLSFIINGIQKDHYSDENNDHQNGEEASHNE